MILVSIPGADRPTASSMRKESQAGEKSEKSEWHLVSTLFVRTHLIWSGRRSFMCLVKLPWFSLVQGFSKVWIPWEMREYMDRTSKNVCPAVPRFIAKQSGTIPGITWWCPSIYAESLLKACSSCNWFVQWGQLISNSVWIIIWVWLKIMVPMTHRNDHV